MDETIVHNPENNNSECERLDKWLNFACIFKTRSQATKACDERKVKVNNEVAKPAKMIKAGDIVTIKHKDGRYINFTVSALTHKNVSAKDARNLYIKEEPELSEEARELLTLYYKSVKRLKPRYKGRPTKKERRKMENIKSGSILSDYDNPEDD
ncbi:MAG TPA: RNA-binding S4 domain-containing protein [bacterium]|nr:RNA-binding S4 domain-containing protein [bacterium]HPN43365.1 RNA-binding S4 domain-containing protein [bacterium]